MGRETRWADLDGSVSIAAMRCTKLTAGEISNAWDSKVFVKLLDVAGLACLRDS